MSRDLFLHALIALFALFVRAPSAAAEDPFAGLESGNAEEVRGAIEELSLTGSPEAAAAIRARLERGLPLALTESAIDALVMLEDRDSLDLLVRLTRHRDASVRKRALEASSILGTSERVEPILLRALEERDPAVRRVALGGLKRLATTRSLPILERALEKREFGAAEIIAKVGEEEQVRPLIGLLGRVPFEDLRGAFETILKRAELGERLRLDALSALVELATPEVKYFLEDLAPTLPGGARDRVRRAVSDAAFRILD